MQPQRYGVPIVSCSLPFSVVMVQFAELACMLDIICTSKYLIFMFRITVLLIAEFKMTQIIYARERENCIECVMCSIDAYDRPPLCERTSQHGAIAMSASACKILTLLQNENIAQKVDCGSLSRLQDPYEWLNLVIFLYNLPDISTLIRIL